MNTQIKKKRKVVLLELMKVALDNENKFVKTPEQLKFEKMINIKIDD